MLRQKDGREAPSDHYCSYIDLNLDYISVFFIGGLLVARQLFTVKVFQLYGKACGGTIDS